MIGFRAFDLMVSNASGLKSDELCDLLNLQYLSQLNVQGTFLVSNLVNTLSGLTQRPCCL